MVRDPRRLPKIFLQLEQNINEGVLKALRDTASFGKTKLQLKTKRMRVRASGTYEQSFVKKDLKNGAFIGNSAVHAVFVERGRNPGKGPPLNPIIEWVKAKRMANKALTVARRKRKGTGKVTRTAARKRYIRLFSHQIARRIQRKIAHRGVKGKWIFKSQFKRIANKAKRESRAAIKRIVANPPK